jgi:hypothetical protein
MDIADRIWEASKEGQAGKDLWKLYNELADDVSDDELLIRLDAYVDDLSAEARALYRKLTNEQTNPQEILNK